MKKFLIVCIASVLSANAPLDSTADSTISIDSRLDSTDNANLDLALDDSPPPQKRVAPKQTI